MEFLEQDEAQNFANKKILFAKIVTFAPIHVKAQQLFSRI